MTLESRGLVSLILTDYILAAGVDEIRAYGLYDFNRDDLEKVLLIAVMTMSRLSQELVSTKRRQKAEADASRLICPDCGRKKTRKSRRCAECAALRAADWMPTGGFDVTDRVPPRWIAVFRLRRQGMGLKEIGIRVGRADDPKSPISPMAVKRLDYNAVRLLSRTSYSEHPDHELARSIVESWRKHRSSEGDA